MERFIGTRAHLSKKTVHNVLTLLIAMLNFAHDLGWLARMPRIRKPRVRVHGADYQYLRTELKMRQFLIAAKAENPMIHCLCAAALYTGARAGELAGLRWEDVDSVSKGCKRELAGRHDIPACFAQIMPFRHTTLVPAQRFSASPTGDFDELSVGAGVHVRQCGDAAPSQARVNRANIHSARPAVASLGVGCDHSGVAK